MYTYRQLTEFRGHTHSVAPSTSEQKLWGNFPEPGNLGGQVLVVYSYHRALEWTSLRLLREAASKASVLLPQSSGMDFPLLA